MSKEAEFGIKYKVTKINEKTFLLNPIGILEGYSVGEIFYSVDIYKTLSDIASLEESILISSIINIEDLKERYDYGDTEDLNFIKDYYLAEEQDNIILIEIINKNIFERKINIHQLTQNEVTEIYERQKNNPVVSLNCDALEKLLNTSDLKTIKTLLEKYKSSLVSFREKEQKEAVTSVTVSNGHVTEINLNKKVDSQITIPSISVSTKLTNSAGFNLSDYSVSGLESYIKERVIGHDEIISDLATIIFMNFSATEEHDTQSVLLIGETGTGKTVTIRCAADYFGLPFEEINTPNIVPQGIKGTTLEDHLYSLIVKCNYDLKRAQRAFVFLDEFDKIGRSELDIKSAVKDIFLKFFEGGNFHIDKPADDYVFNTRMLNKTFAGAFQDLFDAKSSPGFKPNSSSSTEQAVFNESKITESEYFSKELVTRIPHKLVYYPLTRNQKKIYLLESKLSQYLLKKKRYQEEFGIELEATDDYIETILDSLTAKDKSMRDLNNIILNNLIPAERAMLESKKGQYKKLTLTHETAKDRYNFDLR